MPRQVHKTPEETTDGQISAQAIHLLLTEQTLDSVVLSGILRGLVRTLLLKTAGVLDGEGLHRSTVHLLEDEIPPCQVRKQAVELIQTGMELNSVTSITKSMKRLVRALLVKTAGASIEANSHRTTPLGVPISPDFLAGGYPANGNRGSDTTKKR